MRKVFSTLLLAAMMGILGLAQDAGATVTFDLVWIETTGSGVTGSNTIEAVAGDVLTLEIRMTNDQPIGGYGVSLNFDTDLGNELNLFAPHGGANWSGITLGSGPTTTVFAPLAPVGPGILGVTESTGSVAGRINTYNSGADLGPLFLPTGTYAIGTARFVANGIASDGPDVFIGEFNVNIDGVLNDLWELIPPSGLVFGNASVNIPEPGTAHLLGLGLVALVAIRSSRRR